MTTDKDRAAFEAKNELPSLPQGYTNITQWDYYGQMYTEGQMRAYARQAIAHDRRRIRNRVRDRAIAGAALVKDFLAIVDDGDYGAHDRQQRGEPVATIDVKHHDLAGPSAVCLALDAALDLPAGRHEVYAAPVAAQPQPSAEPSGQVLDVANPVGFIERVSKINPFGDVSNAAVRDEAIAMLAAAPAPPAAVPQEAPSDAEIMWEWARTPNTGDMRIDLVVFAKALLARYGSATPAVQPQRREQQIRDTALEEAAGLAEACSRGCSMGSVVPRAVLELAASIRALKAAPIADQPPVIFCDEEHVAVPRGLIGAAISAIDKKREGIKLLAELRRYTVGDLSSPVAVQPQAPAAQGDVIAEDDDGMPVGFAGWYNRRFAMLEVDTSRTAYCEDAWRAALKENSNG